jgi:hypothetical protein
MEFKKRWCVKERHGLSLYAFSDSTGCACGGVIVSMRVFLGVVEDVKKHISIGKSS